MVRHEFSEQVRAGASFPVTVPLQGGGSGFAIDARGHVLSNYHLVIAEVSHYQREAGVLDAEVPCRSVRAQIAEPDGSGGWRWRDADSLWPGRQPVGGARPGARRHRPAPSARRHRAAARHAGAVVVPAPRDPRRRSRRTGMDGGLSFAQRAAEQLPASARLRRRRRQPARHSWHGDRRRRTLSGSRSRWRDGQQRLADLRRHRPGRRHVLPRHRQRLAQRGRVRPRHPGGRAQPAGDRGPRRSRPLLASGPA